MDRYLSSPPNTEGKGGGGEARRLSYLCMRKKGGREGRPLSRTRNAGGGKVAGRAQKRGQGCQKRQGRWHFDIELKWFITKFQESNKMSFRYFYFNYMVFLVLTWGHPGRERWCTYEEVYCEGNEIYEISLSFSPPFCCNLSCRGGVFFRGVFIFRRTYVRYPLLPSLLFPGSIVRRSFNLLSLSPPNLLPISLPQKMFLKIKKTAGSDQSRHRYFFGGDLGWLSFAPFCCGRIFFLFLSFGLLLHFPAKKEKNDDNRKILQRQKKDVNDDRSLQKIFFIPPMPKISAPETNLTQKTHWPKSMTVSLSLFITLSYLLSHKKLSLK